MIGRAFGVPMILAALVVFLVIQGILRGIKVSKTRDRLKEQQEAARQKAADRRLELEKQIREAPKTPKKKRGAASRDMDPAPIDPDF